MSSREEYVEQAYFFRVLEERLADGVPLQDLLAQAKLEALASAKLPLALDFLLGELVHTGTIGGAMAKLAHYFTPFQSYVVSEAEAERGRFDMTVAVQVLRRLAEYMVDADRSPAGLFLYQFETLCRNRLSYDRGLKAMAEDPMYDESWREWIRSVRLQVGLIDFAQLIYLRSEYRRQRRGTEGTDDDETSPALFGAKAGKIARANVGKEAVHLFASLQRHLGYPAVPRPRRVDPAVNLLPQVLRRLDKLEARVKLLEDEQRGAGIDLEQFYRRSGGERRRSDERDASGQ